MPSFVDAAGRTWTLDVNFQSCEDVFRETGVSLVKLFDDRAKPLASLLETTAVFGHVCYILAEAEAAGVSKRDFAKAIKGDPIDTLTRAFLEAVTDFFPDARRRAALGKLTESWQKLSEKTAELVATEFAKVDPEKVSQGVLDRLVSKHERRQKRMIKSSTGPGDKLDSSASTSAG
jgi:hypothetical protein